MDPEPIEQAVRNIDRRLANVEQILPTLATRAELAAAIEPLATRAGMHEAIAAAVAPLATKADVAKEAETTRRRFDAVAERLEGQIRLIAEGHIALDRKIDDVRTELRRDIHGPDRPVTRLEADRLKK